MYISVDIISKLQVREINVWTDTLEKDSKDTINKNKSHNKLLKKMNVEKEIIEYYLILSCMKKKTYYEIVKGTVDNQIKYK